MDEKYLETGNLKKLVNPASHNFSCGEWIYHLLTTSFTQCPTFKTQ